MANRIRGETSFEVDGTVYTLKYTANAICELEDYFDKSIILIVEELAQWQKDRSKVRMSLLRAIFWAGLQDKHPGLTITEAGNLIIGAGGMIKAMKMVAEAFTGSFPDERGNSARPPKRQAGPSPPEEEVGIGNQSGPTGVN